MNEHSIAMVLNELVKEVAKLRGEMANSIHGEMANIRGEIANIREEVVNCRQDINTMQLEMINFRNTVEEEVTLLKSFIRSPGGSFRRTMLDLGVNYKKEVYFTVSGLSVNEDIVVVILCFGCLRLCLVQRLYSSIPPSFSSHTSICVKHILLVQVNTSSRQAIKDENSPLSKMAISKDH